MPESNAPVRAVELEHLDDKFTEAKVPVGADIPDGSYTVVVEQVWMDRTRSSGNPRIRWALRIQCPEPSGKLLWKDRVITEKTLPFLKEDLKACGVELTRLSELPGRLQEMHGLTLEAVKKTKDGRYNVYFARAPQNESPLLEDEIPF